MRRSTGWGIAALLTTAGLAAGCSGGGSTAASGSTAQTRQTGDPGTTSGGSAASSSAVPPPSTSTSTAPPAMSVDDYKKVLQGVNAVLGPDFAAVGKAKTADIGGALEKLANDASDQQGKLPENPPASAVRPTSELMDALKSLSNAAADEKRDAGSKVCAGVSAAAVLSRSDGANQIRTAIQHLGAADQAFANILTFMPAPIQDQNRHLASGTVLRRASGPGKLTIHTADEDAVITLTKVGSKAPVASVYVRSNSTTDLNNVPGSTFEAYISYGNDWDSSAKAFTRDCAFSKTDQTFDFSDSDWELTLYKVTNGNMKEIPVDPNQAPPP